MKVKMIGVTWLMAVIFLLSIGSVTAVGLAEEKGEAGDIVVTLQLPTTGTTTVLTSEVFSCYATNTTSEIANITIYSNLGGTWSNRSTNSTLPAEGAFIHNVTISDITDEEGSLWNCLVCNSTNCVFNSVNFTFTQDDTAPTIVDCNWTRVGNENYRTVTCSTDDTDAQVMKYDTDDESYATMSSSWTGQSGTSQSYNIKNLVVGARNVRYLRIGDDHGNNGSSSYQVNIDVHNPGAAAVVASVAASTQSGVQPAVGDGNVFSGIIATFKGLFDRLIAIFQ